MISQSKRTLMWNIVFCLSSLSISLIMQLAGFVSTGWIYLKGVVYTIHAGLWYRVTCKKGGYCSIAPMINNDSKHNDMLEYQIVATVALAACIIALSFIIIHARYSRGNVITFLMIGLMASTLSGILALVASGKMGRRNAQQHNEQMASYGKSVYKTPYSVFLTGVGGLIACFVTFALAVEVHLINKRKNRTLLVAKIQALENVPSVDTVTTAADDPEYHIIMTTSQDINRRLQRSVLPDDASGESMYQRPTVAATFCSGTALNVVSHVNPLIGDTETQYANSYPVHSDLCGNAILQNGQHIVINDIYDM